MTKRMRLQLATLLFGIFVFGGCASTAPKSPGLAQTDSAVVQAPFSETWQFTKEVLLEKEYILYTRDKRGRFVAWSDPKRRRLRPHRSQFTVVLEPLTVGSTRVTVETLNQRYGVTLLTYPGWHDLKTENVPHAITILDAIEAKASGEEEDGEEESKDGASG